MAAAATRQVTLIVFINRDDAVADFAAVLPNAAVVASGTGAPQLAITARQALQNKWRVSSLGGLDALSKAAKEVEDAALSTLAKQHTDAAYDFLVDNGYSLTWESLFPDTEMPATPAEAAAVISRWMHKAQERGVVSRQTVAGNTSHWPLVAYDAGVPRFRTVQEANAAFEQDPPDQSWMSGDVQDLEEQTAWLQM